MLLLHLITVPHVDLGNLDTELAGQSHHSGLVRHEPRIVPIRCFHDPAAILTMGGEYQAVALLTELRPLTGRWRYVFPSARNDGRPMSENAVRVALRSMGFSNEEMTAHGFRSLGSTALNTLGYRVDVIEAALAHVQGGVRGVYNRSDYWEERRAMMQEWADWLDGLLTSGDSPP